MLQQKIEGNIVDVVNRRIFNGAVIIENGKISAIEERQTESEKYILPGLIDAHIHIESTMLVPSEFARTAVRHGTTAVVSDPHEIANVLGLDGINYMIENAGSSPLKFFFGAPSCVPATPFETSGAELNSRDIAKLMNDNRIHYLSEMMNYPGVIYDDAEVLAKINIAKKLNKPIDGHAPGITGDALKKYINAGISTDHECTSLEEALEKINLGMIILIRQGSAARNFEALHTLISSHNDKIMFCSDDLHPDDLMNGHINLIVKRAIELGYDIFDILTACTVNPNRHYKLGSGTLQQGSPADFIITDNLKDFNILNTFVNGIEVYSESKVNIAKTDIKPINNFKTDVIKPEDIQIKFTGGKLRTIEIIPGEIITGDIELAPLVDDGFIVPDTERDILKIIVINRYHKAKPAVAFIRNFGIKYGAVASCIAHDSHNIVCIGTNDYDICRAVNETIKNEGGIAVADMNHMHSLPLPVAGIMSDKSCKETADSYKKLENDIKLMGSTLASPLMTLSFMALIVIPKLKLSDKGLFDSQKFTFVN